jgi:hypothetical protein
VRSTAARAKRPAASTTAPAGDRRRFARRLLRNLALVAPAAVLAWLLVTPFLNLFLCRAAERLVRLGERPAVTRIALSRSQDALISRSDTRAHGRLPYGVRVTDVHFPLVLLVALFLATPGIPARERLGNLGYALLATLCFAVVDLFFWVKFVYATQLGDWSLAHYDAVARNGWGLGKHLLDLPVKLALPFALWALFYLRLVTGDTGSDPD